MKNTGQLLKDKRESANLSLSEVALATKINPKVLRAIESGDEANLPAKTFLKGFVRSYAVFLKMDVDAVLRSFQDETGGPPVEKIHEAYKTEPSPGATTTRRRVSEENSSGMRTAAVVVIVLLIGLIIGVRELIEKYQREKVVEGAQSPKIIPLVQPPGVVEDPAKATENAGGLPEVKPDPVKLLGTESAPVTPAPTSNPTTETKAPEPVKPPEPPPALAAPQVKPASAPPEVKAVEPVVAEPTPTPAAKIGKNEIILEALDKVDVKFQIKGETKKISLGPTQVHTIHSDQPVTIDLSDGGAVNIILNGRERGVPGDLGKPKQIKIP